jgi:hypothetical protein
LAQFINSELKGTPLGGQNIGAHFVKAGRENHVDPLALVAISSHETHYGELGVGIAKHMGVGAYDSSPSAPRPWDGALDQIYSGAKTFANLRKSGGSSEKAPLSDQLAAVNKAGWASDPDWHTHVGEHYNEIAQDAKAAQAKEAKSAPATAAKGKSESVTENKKKAAA